MESASAELGVSQRKACQTLDLSRSSQRYELRPPVKDAALIEVIRKQIEKLPRYGYRRITVELRKDHWVVNFKRIYRIWHDNDWNVPKKKGRTKRRCAGGSENAAIRKSLRISTISGVMTLCTRCLKMAVKRSY